MSAAIVHRAICHDSASSDPATSSIIPAVTVNEKPAIASHEA